MADESTDNKSAAKADHEPPAGAQTTATWTGVGTEIDYTATASGSSCARRRSRPRRSSPSRTSRRRRRRRVRSTFVFNGGPGASSRRTCTWALSARSALPFPPNGTLPACRRGSSGTTSRGSRSPTSSSSIRSAPASAASSTTRRRTATTRRTAKRSDPKKRVLRLEARSGIARRTSSSRYLSGHRRWASPVFIAGRATAAFGSPPGAAAAGGRRHRAERCDPHLPGAGDSRCHSSDYDVLPWVDLLPTMAARPRSTEVRASFTAGTPLSRRAAEAEAFATAELATFLRHGARDGQDERDRTLDADGPTSRAAGWSWSRARGPDLDRRRSRASCSATSGGSRALRRDDHGAPTRSPTATRSTGPIPTLVGIEPRVTDGDQPAAPRRRSA